MIKRIKTIWTENVPCIRSFQTRNALSDEFTLARAHWKPNPNEELSGTSVLRSSPKPVVGISKPALGFLYIGFDDHATRKRTVIKTRFVRSQYYTIKTRFVRSRPSFRAMSQATCLGIILEARLGIGLFPSVRGRWSEQGQLMPIWIACTCRSNMDKYR